MNQINQVPKTQSTPITETQSITITDLPELVLQNIFSYLNIAEVFSHIRSTCKVFNNLVDKKRFIILYLKSKMEDGKGFTDKICPVRIQIIWAESQGIPFDSNNLLLLDFAARGKMHRVKQTMKRGDDSNVRSPFLGRTPLMNAAIFGNVQVVEHLLLKKMGKIGDINARDLRGESVFTLTAREWYDCSQNNRCDKLLDVLDCLLRSEELDIYKIKMWEYRRDMCGNLNSNNLISEEEGTLSEKNDTQDVTLLEWFASRNCKRIVKNYLDRVDLDGVWLDISIKKHSPYRQSAWCSRIRKTVTDLMSDSFKNGDAVTCQKMLFLWRLPYVFPDIGLEVDATEAEKDAFLSTVEDHEYGTALERAVKRFNYPMIKFFNLNKEIFSISDRSIKLAWGRAKDIDKLHSSSSLRVVKRKLKKFFPNEK